MTIRRKESKNWLEQVALLLQGNRTQRRAPARRRLTAEQLECRNVLSDVALAIDPPPEDPVEPTVLIADDPTFVAIADGSGSGYAATSGSGTTDPPPEDPPPEDPPPEDPPPEDPPPEEVPPEEVPPEITAPEIIVAGDTMTVRGMTTDNSSMSGMTVEIGGVASGTGTVNPDGTFSIDVPCPTASGTITITVTDSDGNVTTIEMEYQSP